MDHDKTLVEPSHPTLDPEVRPSRRFLSLDALRGIAVFGMMIAGVIPWDSLPRWMYHGQEPPPSHEFNANLAGLTWVDLVFPFFLFSMGAAIPLSRSTRSAQGETLLRSSFSLFSRYVLLVAFAIVNQHLRPYSLSSEPGQRIWLLGLLGFLFIFMAYVKLPYSLAGWQKGLVRVIAWGGLVFILRCVAYSDSNGPGFDLHRSDPIILVLANASLFGGAIWLLTKNQWQGRAWVWVLILVFRVSALEPNSWTAEVWNYTGPLSWFFNPSYLGYLLVLIPGTIVGEYVLDSHSHSPEVAPFWLDATIAAVAVGTIPICLYVFLERIPSVWLLPLAGLVVFAGSCTADFLIGRLMRLGSALIALGLILEPFQGGIKKDHPTLSYVVVTPGLAMMMLVALVVLERRRPPFKPLKFAASTGQNPLLAYEALTNLVAPIWALTLGTWASSHMTGTLLGLISAVVQTILLGVVVSLFTRNKIFLRT